MTPGPFELAQAIGSNVGGAFRESRDVSAIDQILGQANQQGTPEAVDNAMGQILSRVSPQNQERALALLQGKQKQLQAQQAQQLSGDARALKERAAEEKLIADQEEQKSVEDSFAASGYPTHLAKLPPGVQTAEIKHLNNKRAEQQQLDIARNSFERLQELVPEVGFVKSGTKSVFPKTDKAFSEFQTLMGGLEGAIREMVNTGRITNTQFQYITEQLLPKPNDRQAQIKGKLEAIASLLGFDVAKGDAPVLPQQEVVVEENLGIRGIQGI